MPPRSPATTSSRSSPFRFTGQAQAHFSPAALSPSPSPPCVSPSLSRRLSSPRRSGSPQRSVSSMSGRSEVLSLEELFPVQPPSEELQSDMSVVSSEGERSCDFIHIKMPFSISFCVQDGFHGLLSYSSLLISCVLDGPQGTEFCFSPILCFHRQIMQELHQCLNTQLLENCTGAVSQWRHFKKLRERNRC